MIIYIEYDRNDSKLVECKEFEDTRKNEASDYRFERECQLFREGKGYHVESVLFRADSLDTLKATHSRYFCTINKEAFAQMRKDLSRNSEINKKLRKYDYLFDKELSTH